MTDHLPSELELADIEARHNAATPGPWGAYTFGGDALIEIAADLEDTGCGYRARREICRLEDEPMDNDPAHCGWTAEEDWAQVQADAEFIAHARGDVGVLLAALRRAHARITELERPAVEAKRNEIRQSFTELIAAAEETRDFEGAFDVQCRLREREEQWAAEDAAATVAAPDAPSAPATARVGVSPASEAARDRRGAEKPPHGRTAAPGVVPASVTLADQYTAAADEMAASLARDGFDADEITEILADPTPRAHGPQVADTTEEAR